MPLVSMKEMLIDAKENGYAVGQYNLNNLEFTQAILEASQEENAPVILGVCMTKKLLYQLQFT